MEKNFRGISDWHDVRLDGEVVGSVTEAVHSPRLRKNIAVGMMSIDIREDVDGLEVSLDGTRRSASIAALPFCR